MIVSAYGFTLLTGKAAQIVIGVMLILRVPLRYADAPPRDVLGDGGLGARLGGLRRAWSAARSAPA